MPLESVVGVMGVGDDPGGASQKPAHPAKSTEDTSRSPTPYPIFIVTPRASPIRNRSDHARSIKSIKDSGIHLKGYRLGMRFVLAPNSPPAGGKAISVKRRAQEGFRSRLRVLLVLQL
jgi:hypothetical protein